MEWPWDGGKTHLHVLDSMLKGFQSVNEVICNNLQRRSPRLARFGHRFEVLHDFTLKPLQEAAEGKVGMVRHQEGGI